MPKVVSFDETSKPQADKFRELACELGADEDEAAFEETLKRIAPKGPDQAGDDQK